MIIEITGCSGSGKTTLARMLLERLKLCGYNVRHNVFFSESPVRQMLENLYWDAIALRELSFSNDIYKPFINLAAHTLLAFDASFLSRMNIMRSVKRKVGTYAIFQKNNNDNVVSVMDEGTVHTAHVLFAHPLNSNRSLDYRPFSECVPVPDILIYVRSDIELVIRRTMLRRDQPWVFLNIEEVERFVNNANKMFETILFESILNKRTKLVTVEGVSRQKSLDEIIVQVKNGNK